MVTDEERREAVENLRCLSYMNRVRYKEEFYELPEVRGDNRAPCVR